MELEEADFSHLGFTIAFPTGWERGTMPTVQSPNGPRHLVFAGRKGMTPTGPREDVIHVIVEPLKRALSTDEYVQYNRREFSRFTKNYQRHETGSSPIAGVDTPWDLYSHGEELRATALVYFFTNRGKGYAVTCSSSSSSFDPMRPLFEKVASTFRLH